MRPFVSIRMPTITTTCLGPHTITFNLTASSEDPSPISFFPPHIHQDYDGHLSNSDVNVFNQHVFLIPLFRHCSCFIVRGAGGGGAVIRQIKSVFSKVQEKILHSSQISQTRTSAIISLSLKHEISPSCSTMFVPNKIHTQE